MDLKKCLELLANPIFTSNIVYFQSEQYPALFFSLFFARYKEIHSRPSVYIIDVSNTSLAEIQCQLQTSFLGEVTLYWLKDISVLEGAHLSALLTYLVHYKGPNKVLFFIPQATSFPSWPASDIITFQFPFFIQIEQIIVLEPLFKMPIKGLMVFAQKAAAVIDKISLDEAALLVQYSGLLGNNMDLFFTEWIQHIVKPDLSLFLLSQYFFSKKTSLFFKMWKKIQGLYNEAFWLVYWSEQVWRAAIYITLRKENNIADAKKISYKLPFSFVNNDWRNYSVDELKNAHQFLYECDYQLKNGGGVIGLDLFYTIFFLQKFI